VAAETTDNWIRYRFHANEDDWRPVYDPNEPNPNLGPYWCSGYGDGYSIIVAYLRAEPTLYWPEASHIDEGEPGPIKFSDRFPKPSWWQE
jgi:hypothetical protein